LCLRPISMRAIIDFHILPSTLHSQTTSGLSLGFFRFSYLTQSSSFRNNFRTFLRLLSITSRTQISSLPIARHSPDNFEFPLAAFFSRSLQVLQL
jgi:hypothetical protein